ncbi:cellulose biosynthesis protein BcsQ [Alcaligenes endophyticus]|uniref:Cellulose synthase operon protein YhjQ n=1 Tax=Alcaligenes endophyticus TaxID=1929088 RepID=A0ABT8EF01_9BURK|nr:cellulose biosynthesis protein BcsQ [Alcaligenes endophyticus]MCX5592349.1 cellulose biosynthesis protein BcsQ [Alcaligenes endophyticus]MDN4119792.1 cellulose synthase operon protein YhjQ [Alcaligenes endophyticus]
MNIIAVVSAKGGVGKTTVSASLGEALVRQGQAVLAVDLDPQNALRFHYFRDQAFEHTHGLAQTCVEELPLAQALLSAPTPGIVLLPYGQCTEANRDQFERQLREQPYWLKERLLELKLPEQACVVIDTPPGPSVYLQQALRAANFVVIVVLADAGSYITLPQMHGLIGQYCDPKQGFVGAGVLLNQVDRARALATDVALLLSDEEREMVIGRIHTDPAIAESLACGMTVFDYMENSEAVRDFMAVAREVLSQLDQ